MKNMDCRINSDGDLMTKLQNFFQIKCAKNAQIRLLEPLVFKVIKSNFQGKLTIYMADWKIEHFSDLPSFENCLV